MKAIVTILSKTLIRSFYKEFVLFFLIALYICFGLLTSSDHIFLNTYIVSSGILIGVYFILWTLYNLFVIRFTLSFIQKSENSFLYHLQLGNGILRFISLLIVHIYLFAPAMAYAVFVGVIATNLGFYNQLVYILLFLGISVFIPVFIYTNAISKPDISHSNSFFLRLNLRFKKRYFSFFFFHLFENEWLKLLISKGLSVVLLSGLVQILQTDNDDIRPLLVVVLMGFLPNFSLVGSYHAFENTLMIWFKNMPVQLHKKWLMALATFAIVLLPEVFLLYRFAWSALPIGVPMLAWLFGVSLLSLYYSSLYLRVATEERFSNLIFIAALVCFLAILFKINVLIIALVVLLISILLFFRKYYSYEFLVKS